MQDDVQLGILLTSGAGADAPLPQTFQDLLQQMAGTARPVQNVTAGKSAQTPFPAFKGTGQPPQAAADANTPAWSGAASSPGTAQPTARELPLFLPGPPRFVSAQAPAQGAKPEPLLLPSEAWDAAPLTGNAAPRIVTSPQQGPVTITGKPDPPAGPAIDSIAPAGQPPIVRPLPVSPPRPAGTPSLRTLAGVRRPVQTVPSAHAHPNASVGSSTPLLVASPATELEGSQAPVDGTPTPAATTQTASATATFNLPAATTPRLPGPSFSVSDPANTLPTQPALSSFEETGATSAVAAPPEELQQSLVGSPAAADAEDRPAVPVPGGSPSAPIGNSVMPADPLMPEAKDLVPETDNVAQTTLGEQRRPATKDPPERG